MALLDIDQLAQETIDEQEVTNADFYKVTVISFIGTLTSLGTVTPEEGLTLIRQIEEASFEDLIDFRFIQIMEDMRSALNADNLVYTDHEAVNPLIMSLDAQSTVVQHEQGPFKLSPGVQNRIYAIAKKSHIRGVQAAKLDLTNVEGQGNRVGNHVIRMMQFAAVFKRMQKKHLLPRSLADLHTPDPHDRQTMHDVYRQSTSVVRRIEQLLLNA